MTAEKKLQAIERVRNGESKVTATQSIRISGLTFRNWYKLEEKIKSQMRNPGYLAQPLPSYRNIISRSPAASMQIDAENTVHPVNKRSNKKLDAAVPRKRARMEHKVKSTATTARSAISPYEDKIRSLSVNNPALKNLISSENSLMNSYTMSRNYEINKQQIISFLFMFTRNIITSSDVSGWPQKK